MLRILSCASARSIPIKVLTCLPTRCFTTIKTQTHNFYTSSHLNSSISRISFQKSESEIVESHKKNVPQKSFGNKVKETGVDITYIGMVLFGVVIAGVIFYAVGLELFSTQSPNGIYNEANKLCLKDEGVINALGHPIKSLIGGRGRLAMISCFFNFLVSQGFGVEDPILERYASYVEFMEGGTKVMKLQFFLEGSLDKGRVLVEARQDSKGLYEIARIVLQLDQRPYNPIVVLDKK